MKTALGNRCGKKDDFIEKVTTSWEKKERPNWDRFTIPKKHIDNTYKIN
jgi:hypothetical protein